MMCKEVNYRTQQVVLIALEKCKKERNVSEGGRRVYVEALNRVVRGSLAEEVRFRQKPGRKVRKQA